MVRGYKIAVMRQAHRVAERNDSNPRRRRLGTELRKLRERSGYTTTSAAEAVEDFSQSKVSRIERGGVAVLITWQSSCCVLVPPTASFDCFLPALGAICRCPSRSKGPSCLKVPGIWRMSVRSKQAPLASVKGSVECNPRRCRGPGWSALT